MLTYFNGKATMDYASSGSRNDVVKGLCEPAIQAQVRSAMRNASLHKVDAAMPDRLAQLLAELDRVTERALPADGQEASSGLKPNE